MGSQVAPRDQQERQSAGVSAPAASDFGLDVENWRPTSSSVSARYIPPTITAASLQKDRDDQPDEDHDDDDDDDDGDDDDDDDDHYDYHPPSPRTSATPKVISSLPASPPPAPAPARAPASAPAPAHSPDPAPPPAPSSPGPSEPANVDLEPEPEEEHTVEDLPTGSQGSESITTNSARIRTKTRTRWPLPATTMETFSRTSSITSFSIAQHVASRSLLAQHCATAEFTLIDGGATQFYVPFVGCMNNKLDCCSFTPRTAIPVEEIMTDVSSARITPRALSSGTDVYPRPIDPGEVELERCAIDYYSISGSCCPSGYTPWTTLMGDATPCYIHIKTTTPPPIPTSKSASLTRKPTGVIADTVYAMQYAVQDAASTGLSPGAIAGIAIGSSVGLFAIIGLAIMIHKRLKHSRRMADLKKELRSSYYPETGASEVPVSRNGTLSSDLNSVQRIGSQGLSDAQLHRAQSVSEANHTSTQAVYTPDHMESTTPAELFSTSSAQGEREDMLSLPSCTSSPARDIQEVQLARPQRLSRGYARVVYTNTQGSSQGSNSTMPADVDVEARPDQQGAASWDRTIQVQQSQNNPHPRYLGPSMIR
ncbi:hypothetical protein B0H63DRAFT_128856 [Podospora didyma]|uniref:Uncharacterized protein n=1 Tax=Podospora didyma TaxID=330526 RepID=A0AAE0P086_9PEZI|nr:hypothetical protein B0H63DRAFT_128856 [Podospora didyma]